MYLLTCFRLCTYGVHLEQLVLRVDPDHEVAADHAQCRRRVRINPGIDVLFLIQKMAITSKGLARQNDLSEFVSLLNYAQCRRRIRIYTGIIML